LDPTIVRGDENYEAIVDVIDIVNVGEIKPELWILRWHCEEMGSATIQAAEKSGPVFAMAQAFKKAKFGIEDFCKVNLWSKLPVGSKMHIAKAKKLHNKAFYA